MHNNLWLPKVNDSIVMHMAQYEFMTEQNTQLHLNNSFFRKHPYSLRDEQ